MTLRSPGEVTITTPSFSLTGRVEDVAALMRDVGLVGTPNGRAFSPPDSADLDAIVDAVTAYDQSPVDISPRLTAKKLRLRKATESDLRYALLGLERISRHNITRRDLQSAWRGRFKNIPDLLPVVAMLEAGGYLRHVGSSPAKGHGQRPSPVYEVDLEKVHSDLGLSEAIS